MTTPLTPDEIRARLNYETEYWDRELGFHLDNFKKAGLVVVDATDTPGDPETVIALRNLADEYDRLADRAKASGVAVLELPLLHARAVLAGGSPGERGTATQDTSADPTRCGNCGHMWEDHHAENGCEWYGCRCTEPRPTPEPDYAAILTDVPTRYLLRELDERRRAPQPATERVPWHQAKGRILMADGKSHGVCYGVIDYDLSGDPDGTGPQALYMDGPSIVRVRPDDGGTVEVLVENEETGT